MTNEIRLLQRDVRAGRLSTDAIAARLDDFQTRLYVNFSRTPKGAVL